MVIHSEIISKFLNNRRSRQHKFENINTIIGTYLVTTHAQIMVIRGASDHLLQAKAFFVLKKIVLSLVEVTNKRNTMSIT